MMNGTIRSKPFLDAHADYLLTVMCLRNIISINVVLVGICLLALNQPPEVSDAPYASYYSTVPSARRKGVYKKRSVNMEKLSHNVSIWSSKSNRSHINRTKAENRCYSQIKENKQISKNIEPDKSNKCGKNRRIEKQLSKLCNNSISGITSIMKKSTIDVIKVCLCVCVCMCVCLRRPFLFIQV